jgi:hypothetical protein
MEYLYIALGMILCAVCYIVAFDWSYHALLRKQVAKNQKEWDKIKAELEEQGADYIEIAEAYGRYMAVCGGCYPRL